MHPLEQQPAEHRGRRGDERVHDRLGGDAVRGECRAGVEARPTEPQDAGADHRQRQAVRRHRPVGIAPAHAEHEDQCERGGSRVHVHDRSTREVERALACEPSTGEHHVRDRRVHDDQPHRDEDHVRGELQPVGRRSGDQRGRDDRERHLERAEQHERDRERSEEPVRIGSAGPTSFIHAKSKLPMKPSLPALPNDRLNAIAHHRTPRIPIAKKFCISMPSTFLRGPCRRRRAPSLGS